MFSSVPLIAVITAAFLIKMSFFNCANAVICRLPTMSKNNIKYAVIFFIVLVPRNHCRPTRQPATS